MVQYSPLDATFAALSDPIRRATLERLAQGEASVGELAAPHAITLPGMLKHVRSLERAGLIQARKEGRTRICRLVAAPLHGAMAWLSHYQRFWTGQLDALDRYLQETSWTSPPPPPTSPSKSPAPTPHRRRVSSRRGRKPRR